MKNIKRLIAVIILVLIASSVYAQKKQKVKGNKEVIEVYHNLASFSSIEINDDIDVSLMQSNSASYRLKTDSNLIDVVRVEVIDSILKIYTTQRIVSSKKLELQVNFTALNNLTVKGNSSVEGQNKINTTDINISTYDQSKIELDIIADKAIITMHRGSDAKLKLKSVSSEMTLNDNAYVKGSFSIDNLALTVNKRADMNIQGNVEHLKLMTTGSTDIKAKKLKATTAELNASNSSDIYLYISKELNIYAKGRSYIYVYGNPEIKVEGLNDKSQIIKK